jgi:hypothetical protein
MHLITCLYVQRVFGLQKIGTTYIGAFFPIIYGFYDLSVAESNLESKVPVLIL